MAPLKDLLGDRGRHNGMSNQVNEALLKVSAQDRMRMERIVMDHDSEDAIALVKQWLEIVARTGRSGMQSHLDGGAPQ